MLRFVAIFGFLVGCGGDAYKSKEFPQQIKQWELESRKFQESYESWSDNKPVDYSYYWEVEDTKISVDVVGGEITCRTVELGSEVLFIEDSTEINTHEGFFKAKTLGVVYERCKTLDSEDAQHVEFDYIDGVLVGCNKHCDVMGDCQEEDVAFDGYTTEERFCGE